MKDILKEATDADGVIDFQKVARLQQEKSEKEMIDRAKSLDNWEQLVGQATDEKGKVNNHKLHSHGQQRWNGHRYR